MSPLTSRQLSTRLSVDMGVTVRPDGALGRFTVQAGAEGGENPDASWADTR